MSARLIFKLRVAERVKSGEDTAVLSFVHPMRPELPAWEAGAHVDVHLPDGRIRHYSLCGDPADRCRYQIAIKREAAGRGGSAWLLDHLAPGDSAQVSAPSSHFSLAPDASRHVFIAGGIGVTPFLAMGHAARARGEPCSLHYCVRDEAAPLIEKTREIFGPAMTVHVGGSNRLDVAELISTLQRESDAHLYVCGPDRLLAAVRDAAAVENWPLARLHFEVFRPLYDENFTARPFDIRIASSGHILHVGAEESALDALLRAGIDISSSCRLGICGACKCRYISGDVLHRDNILHAEQRRHSLLTCVSRAETEVVLDL